MSNERVDVVEGDVARVAVVRTGVVDLEGRGWRGGFGALDRRWSDKRRFDFARRLRLVWGRGRRGGHRGVGGDGGC